MHIANTLNVVAAKHAIPDFRVSRDDSESCLRSQAHKLLKRIAGTADESIVREAMRQLPVGPHDVLNRLGENVAGFRPLTGNESVTRVAARARWLLRFVGGDDFEAIAKLLNALPAPRESRSTDPIDPIDIINSIGRKKRGFRTLDANATNQRIASSAKWLLRDVYANDAQRLIPIIRAYG